MGGKFSGTFADFYYWFDATIKAWVTRQTKKDRNRHRLAHGCHSCNSKDFALQAHHHPLGRKALVRKALGVTSDADVLTNLDLTDAFRKIEGDHKPYVATLQYLCDACHKKAHLAAGEPK